MVSFKSMCVPMVAPRKDSRLDGEALCISDEESQCYVNHAA